MKKVLMIIVIALLAVSIAGCNDRKTDESRPVVIPAQAAETAKTADAPAAPVAEQKAEKTVEEIDLKTKDGVSIKGTYYKGTTSKGAVLLHMLGSDRSSWKGFAQDLQGKGYHVVAIDFRGHGDSQGDWRDFKESEFEERNDFIDMENDVEAAAAFIKKNAAWPKTIIGASIGANIALRYAGNTPEVEKVVLISPGLSYKGVRTSEAAMTYRGQVLMVGSSGDAPYVEANEKLNRRFVGKHRTFEYSGNGHGTDLFRLESGLSARITGWLDG